MCKHIITLLLFLFRIFWQEELEEQWVQQELCIFVCVYFTCVFCDVIFSRLKLFHSLYLAAEDTKSCDEELHCW